MATEAVVTIKLKPSEFDLVREALSWHYTNSSRTGRDKETTSELRREASAKAMRLADLITKLS